MQTDEYFTNNDPRLANTDRKKTVTLKDYFMKHFQSEMPKAASKSGPLMIEMKTFDKNNPFPNPRQADKEDNDYDAFYVGNETNQSSITDFLDNLQELYQDLYLTRKQKFQFMNLLIYLENLLMNLSKNSGDRRIQIVDNHFKEDCFMIMLLSLGYEITFWSEDKILLNIGAEPSKEFLSLAIDAIQLQFLQNPQLTNPSTPEPTRASHQSRPQPTPTVTRQPEPTRTFTSQAEEESKSGFLASKHEERLRKMNQANTSATVNTNTNSYTRDTRNNRYTEPSYMDNQAEEYRNMMRSRNDGPGYNTQTQQGYGQSFDYRQRQQPEQTPQYYQNTPIAPSGNFEDDLIVFGLTALEFTNQFRVNNGIPELDWCQTLFEIAMEHSKAMAIGKVPFGHQGFDRRCEKSGYPAWSIAENVGANEKCANPPEVAVQGWINSGAHRKNLLARAEVCGIGCYQGANGTWYFTQILALRE